MALDYGSKPPWKARRWLWALAVILISALAVFFWNFDGPIFPREQTATVLCLDDCDDDFRNPPFWDAVVAFHPKGKPTRLATHLNICQTVGGGRSLSVSADGKYFVVCEIAGKHLTAYETQTGNKLWSIDGEFIAATLAQDGGGYAVTSSGKIYGDRTVRISEAGKVTKSADAAGFDIALDAKRKVLWEVGKTIRKCDLELNVLQEITPIKWSAVSVDVSPDGSIWVAEREHRDVAQSTDRILKISSAGQILKAVYLEWSPRCIRVDQSDGSVWATGSAFRKAMGGRILEAIERRTGALPLGKKFREFLKRPPVWSRTQKYDSEGNLLRIIKEGGHSIDIQQSDGSLWLAGKTKIYHYSREGKKLATLGGVSNGQKWMIVVPNNKRVSQSKLQITF